MVTKSFFKFIFYTIFFNNTLKLKWYNMNMVKYIFSAIVGYLLGSLSPASLISKIKNKDIRECGTKNLGATNVMLNFGKGFGAVVMLFDIAKSFVSFKIMQMIFPSSALVGMIAGSAAVVGHVFPVHHDFKGGKGLASFGGLVLAYNPQIFLFLALTGLTLMLIVNYSFILPFYGALAFPLMVARREESVMVFVVSLAVSVIVFVKHYPNMLKAKNGEDKTIREYIKHIK